MGERPQKPTRRHVGLLQVIRSVSAAAFGVQARKNQEADFNSGNPVPFIIGGLIFTLVFVISIALIVHWVIRTQGG